MCVVHPRCCCHTLARMCPVCLQGEGWPDCFALLMTTPPTFADTCAGGVACCASEWGGGRCRHEPAASMPVGLPAVARFVLCCTSSMRVSIVGATSGAVLYTRALAIGGASGRLQEWHVRQTPWTYIACTAWEPCLVAGPLPSSLAALPRTGLVRRGTHRSCQGGRTRTQPPPRKPLAGAGGQGLTCACCNGSRQPLDVQAALRMCHCQPISCFLARVTDTYCQAVAVPAQVGWPCSHQCHAMHWHNAATGAS